MDGRPHALAGWQTGNFYESLVSQVRIDDLRAYVALFAYAYPVDGADPSEPIVHEVRPLDIVAPLNTAHEGAGSAVVDRWPISRVRLDWQSAVDPRLHMVAHIPNPRDDSEIIAELGINEGDLTSGRVRFAIWIGGAHSPDA